MDMPETYYRVATVWTLAQMLKALYKWLKKKRLKPKRKRRKGKKRK